MPTTHKLKGRYKGNRPRHVPERVRCQCWGAVAPEPTSPAALHAEWCPEYRRLELR